MPAERRAEQPPRGAMWRFENRKPANAEPGTAGSGTGTTRENPAASPPDAPVRQCNSGPSFPSRATEPAAIGRIVVDVSALWFSVVASVALTVVLNFVLFLCPGASRRLYDALARIAAHSVHEP